MNVGIAKSYSIVRYDAGQPCIGAAAPSDGSIVRIEDGLAAAVGRAWEIALDAADGPVVEGASLLASAVPTGVLRIGLNYRKHAEESGAQVPEQPILFMKLPSAVQNPGRDIVLPRRLRSDQVDYEASLAVVIGRPCRNVAREEALDEVVAYTCGNDVSARDWQLESGEGG